MKKWIAFTGLSESINWLITFRGLQSLGAACVFATGVIMISEILGQEKFNQAAAIKPGHVPKSW